MTQNMILVVGCVFADSSADEARWTMRIVMLLDCAHVSLLLDRFTVTGLGLYNFFQMSFLVCPQLAFELKPEVNLKFKTQFNTNVRLKVHTPLLAECTAIFLKGI